MTRVLPADAIIYLAGPMRGYPRWNFDAFHKWRDSLRSLGYKVVSPADIDLDMGFDPDGPESQVDERFMREAARRDIDELTRCDAVLMMPGWERSTGVAAEASAAFMCGIPVYQIIDRDSQWGVIGITREEFLKAQVDAASPRSDEDIRAERQVVYGDPRENHEGIAQMWASVLQPHWQAIRDQVPVPAHVVALLMAALKLNRMRLVYHPDNYADARNYLAFAEEWQKGQQGCEETPIVSS